MNEIKDSNIVALVIVGAGLSGVSALTVARKYVPRSEKIVIADIRSDYGGQWLDAYDFVRLHQPYQHYTAFDEPWDMKKPRTHLASRDEVLNHLRDLGRRGSPHTLFGHRYIKHEKVLGRDDLLEVTFERLGEIEDENERIVKVKTKRLLKAAPFKHITHQGFHLSSRNVQSIDITQLSQEFTQFNNSLGAREDTHYIIVGSGKSAMDAINYLHSQIDTKKTPLSLIAGNGIAFFCRDTVFPRSMLKRQLKGYDISGLLLEYSLKWNGTNQAALMRELERRKIFISPVHNPFSCVYGTLGLEELEDINESIGEIVRGRMLDIVDSPDGNELQVLLQKTGEKVPLKLWKKGRRTVVVNCTQLYDTFGPPQPLLCDDGKTLISQLVFLLPGPSTAFLTHAWYLNKLKGENGLVSRLRSVEVSSDPNVKDKSFFEVALVGTYNVSLLAQTLPMEILKADKTNVDNWYPLWRRALTSFKMNKSFPKIEAACAKFLGNNWYPTENEDNSGRTMDGKLL